MLDKNLQKHADVDDSDNSSAYSTYPLTPRGTYTVEASWQRGSKLVASKTATEPSTNPAKISLLSHE